MIDKLYDVVVKNEYDLYIENIDLFNEFYNRRDEFFSSIDKDSRIVDIIKYMFINDDDFDISIINDLLIRFKEINVCNNLLNKEKINILINNLNNYNSIKEIISNSRYVDNLAKYSLNIIKEFIKSDIDIEILNIFINNLSNNFLSFDKNDILLMINTIENYNYDNMIIGNKNDIICNFVDNYSYNYLEIKNMCTDLDIKNDKLLNYLFYNNKVDTDLYYLLIFNRISNDNLLEFFDNDLKNYKTLLDNHKYINDKLRILNTGLYKYFNRDEYKEIIDIYNFNNQKGDRYRLNEFILNDNPLLLNDDLINYILINNLENKYFLLNLYECKDKLDLKDDTLSLIDNKLKKMGNNINKIDFLNNMDISLSIASKLIRNCLKRNNVNEDKLMLYIRKFIKSLLKCYRIDDINVIYGSHNKKSGYYNEETNTIFLNIDRI